MKRIVLATFALALYAAPLNTASADQVYYGQTALGNRATQPFRPPARGETRIACTVVGCIPIKPNCHPETGYTADGTPSGFDVVVCK